MNAWRTSFLISSSVPGTEICRFSGSLKDPLYRGAHRWLLRKSCSRLCIDGKRRSSTASTSSLDHLHGTTPQYRRMAIISPRDGSTDHHHREEVSANWPSKVEGTGGLTGRLLSALQALPETTAIVSDSQAYMRRKKDVERAVEDTGGSPSVDVTMLPEGLVVLDVVEHQLSELVQLAHDPKTLTTSSLRIERLPQNQFTVLVCVHGTRDCRCGAHGGALRTALEEHVKKDSEMDKSVTIMGVSHVGGHKWAANAIVEPLGDWYGNLRAPQGDASKLLELLHAQTSSDRRPVWWEKWRGRRGVDREAQIQMFERSANDKEKAIEEKESVKKKLAIRPLPEGKEEDILRLKCHLPSGEDLVLPALRGESLMHSLRRPQFSLFDHPNYTITAAQKEGLEAIQATCEGNCDCATCHVYIRNASDTAGPAPVSEPSEDEEDMLDYALGHQEGESRLSCQITVTDSLADWTEAGGRIVVPKY